MKIKLFRKIFCLFLIILLGINNYPVFSANSSWNALDNFTNRQYNLLFESNLSNVSSEYWDIFDMSRKVDVFNNLWESIKRSRESVEACNTAIINKLKDLEESKKKIEEEIIEITKKIQDISLASNQLKIDIEQNEKKIKVLKNQIEENKKVLLALLDYLYKKWNTAYDWTKIDNLKSIILNDEDISTLINDLYYNWIIQITWKKLAEKHMQFIKDLYIKQVELKNKKIEFAYLRKQFILEQKKEKEKREFKERLIEISKNRQKEYEKVIAETIKTESRVKEIAESQEKKIKEIKEKVLSENWCTYVDFSKESQEKSDLEKNNKKCYDLNKIIFLEWQLNESKNVTVTKNPLSWPVNPIKWLSAYYKDPWYKKELWADHNAIDIRVPQWTPIQAPMDWYVIYINPPTTKDYSFLALKHSNGYTTVFWHLSEIDVSLYQYVEKWQIIWKSGWEYWTNWAWFLSTWPHLHFETFKDKKYIDPLDVLDLSYLKYWELPTSPAKYKIKFLTDFKQRRWFDYTKTTWNSKIFKLEWDTEIDRQKYLISKYAAWSFNDWQAWVDEALVWNIDPSMVMCIWLAESGLWRNLTTAYNVWNVWNNDRWDRIWYWSAKEWIRQIVKALNNKFLWSINRLDLLSWAWRIASGLPSCKEQPFCYATDTRYWHPNMVTCLSHLKWEIIKDDYNFRQAKN